MDKNTIAPQQSSRNANESWMARAIDRGEEEVLEEGQDLLEKSQNSAQEVINYGNTLAKRAGERAMSFGKSHPIQMAVGGIALGFMLGYRIFGKRGKDA